MRVYKFSEARQKLAEVLDLARDEDVLIERRGGETFVLSLKRPTSSPLDLPKIDRELVTTDDIIEAVRQSRQQPWRKDEK
jgi:Antitoxin Phd_YefM, type II toxin-antitoxin system